MESTGGVEKDWAMEMERGLSGARIGWVGGLLDAATEDNDVIGKGVGRWREEWSGV